MGITKLYDYWSTSEALHNFPIASKIPRKGFLEIQRFFTNNADIIPRGQEGHDRLAKVRPVLDSVRTNFRYLYMPNRENAIDVAMVKFYGRSCLKQYVIMKPVRRGFKVWVRADCINGYICDFAVYTGKEGVVEKDLGGKVVRAVSYDIYFDNCFTSVKLLEDLLDDGLYACGTFRRDRNGIPNAPN